MMCTSLLYMYLHLEFMFINLFLDLQVPEDGGMELLETLGKNRISNAFKSPSVTSSSTAK